MIKDMSSSEDVLTEAQPSEIMIREVVDLEKGGLQVSNSFAPCLISDREVQNF